LKEVGKGVTNLSWIRQPQRKRSGARGKGKEDEETIDPEAEQKR